MGKVLVVGGGIAGMQASLDLAAMDHQVFLVEKEESLGGNLRRLYKVFPTNEKAETVLADYLEKIEAQNNVTVYTDSTILDFKGKAPAFKVTVHTRGKKHTLSVGAIVLATGFSLFDPAEKKEYGYGRYRDVISAVDLERMLKDGKLERPSDAKKPESVVFVQCVGFRDVRANEYCSSFCCISALKNAVLIKKEHPEMEITVMYMDIRTPSLYEQMYSDARNLGVRFIRSRPAEIFEKNNKLVVNFENTLTGKTQTMESDLVVLSIGAIPSPETKELCKMMGLSISKTGFFEVVSEPLGTGVPGIFVAGVNCGPKDTSYSRTQGSAAAAQVNKTLRNPNVTG
ncbi:MAG: CoB--CoM heterodisulfide reductase iron-sulfur subunit A family protein [Candidatus Bathyarchaeia archaeon]